MSFVLFDDDSLAFVDLSEGKYSAFVVSEEKYDYVDYGPDMNLLGSMLLSMCTGEDFDC